MPNIFGGDFNNKALMEDAVIGKLYSDRLGDFEGSGTSHVVLVCGQWYVIEGSKTSYVSVLSPFYLRHMLTVYPSLLRYEWSLGLPKPWFGFDIRQRDVTFYDDGKTRINVSTWDQCGRAIAALLSLPESGASPCVADWKNQPLYISSFRVSQRDMLDSLNRVVGTTDKDWKIDDEPTDKRYERGMKEMKEGNPAGFATALYARAFYPSKDGDFQSKYGLANETLGLPKEDLDEITKRTVEMVENGFVEKTFKEMSGQ